MHLKLFKLIKKFLTKLSFKLLKISSVVLIILITVQIIISNPDFANSIVQQYVGHQFETETDLTNQDVKPATQTVSKNVKRLTLKLKNETYKEDITIRLNDQKISDFTEEIVSLEIESGDEIAIDAREIKEGVWIEILEKPTFIDYEGDFLWLNNQLRKIDTISISA